MNTKNKCKVPREGVVGNLSTITIYGVLLVKGLQYNLLRVSQLCDNGYSIVFYNSSCLIEHKASKNVMFKDSRVDNIYLLYLDDVSRYDTNYLVTKN